MNTLHSVIKNLIQINVITAMLSVLVFVAIREQQATTTDKQTLLDEPQAYHSAVKEKLSDEQRQLQDSHFKLQEQEKRIQQIEGLLEANNAQKLTLNWDELTAKTASKQITVPANISLSKSSNQPSAVSQTNLLLNPQPLYQASQEQWQASKGLKPIKYSTDTQTEVNRHHSDHSDIDKNNISIISNLSEITPSIPKEQATTVNFQSFISSEKLTFNYWSALLFQPFFWTAEKSNQSTFKVQEANLNQQSNIKQSEEFVIASNQEDLDVVPSEAELPITPMIAYSKGNPRIEKDKSISYANDIAYGLTVANEKGHINYGTNAYRRVQTAIRLLRRGENLDDAARRAEIETEVLSQLIKWGENRPGGVAALPQANGTDSKLR